MSIQEEQERRHDLLLKALEACPDPEQALTVAGRMEQFIIDGQTSRKKPHEVTQPAGLPSSEGSRKTSNRSRWSGDDDAHLRRLWQSNLTIEAIAQELHRTPASIYGRVRILDLSSGKRDTKNGKRKIKLPGSDRRSLNVISKAGDGIEADAPKIDGPHKSSKR
jgi:hypothetical protein